MNYNFVRKFVVEPLLNGEFKLKDPTADAHLTNYEWCPASKAQSIGAGTALKVAAGAGLLLGVGLLAKMFDPDAESKAK